MSAPLPFTGTLRSTPLRFFVAFVPLLAGCISFTERRDAFRPAPQTGRPPVGTIFVANGSGDFRTVTNHLAEAVVESCAPLQIDTIVWTRGRGRYFTDHIDHANHVDQGCQLAARIVAYRRAYPGQRVYLVGHSAGCAVVLAAAEALPPDSIDRIVLLAPSVCYSYDLRPALRASRRGIDVFHSDRDSVILGLGMRIVGTADRGCGVAAGERGFAPVIQCPADSCLYAKLRQHPWDPAVAWTGNRGGHYGSNQPGFLRAYVVPLLLSDS